MIQQYQTNKQLKEAGKVCHATSKIELYCDWFDCNEYIVKNYPDYDQKLG